MNRFFYLKKIKNNSEFIGMDNFFKEIEYDKKSKKEKNFSPFKNQMDLFYICLLIGIKFKEKLKIDSNNHVLGDMTANWTDTINLSGAKDLVVALYVATTIEETDKNYDNKKKVQSILNHKLGKDPIRSLSEEGMDEIHEYSFGGYLKLLKLFKNKSPENLSDFFDKIASSLLK